MFSGFPMLVLIVLVVSWLVFRAIRRDWCACSRLVAAFRSVRLGRDVRLHRNGSFQQGET